MCASAALRARRSSALRNAKRAREESRAVRFSSAQGPWKWNTAGRLRSGPSSSGAAAYSAKWASRRPVSPAARGAARPNGPSRRGLAGRVFAIGADALAPLRVESSDGGGEEIGGWLAASAPGAEDRAAVL